MRTVCKNTPNMLIFQISIRDFNANLDSHKQVSLEWKWDFWVGSLQSCVLCKASSPTALQKVILCPLLTMLDSFWRNISPPRLLIFLTILVFVSFRLGLLFNKSATNHQGKTSLPKGSTISGGTFLTRAKMSDAIFWRNFMCIKEKKRGERRPLKKTATIWAETVGVKTWKNG